LWEFDALLKAVGSVHRSVAIKALATWVDLGVLKEDSENTFLLLERAEEGGGPSVARDPSRHGKFLLDFI